MERRYFFKTNLLILLTYASRLSTLEAKEIGHELHSTSTFYELKKNELVKLPKKPIDIETLVHFKMPTNCSKKDLPKLLANGKKINGVHCHEIDLKESGLDVVKDFYLQFAGDDIGWIILT